MRILIFGAGAVGQALGVFLLKSGQQVDLLLRERFAAGISQRGLQVTGIFGDCGIAAGDVCCVTSIEDVRDIAYDLAIVTTKSYDTDEAVQALRMLEQSPKAVMSMQNGCGNVQKLADAFGVERTLGARVITGFQIDRPGLVRITVTQDAIRVGPAQRGLVPPIAEDFARALDRAGMPCAATEDVYKDLYAKLLYNCALNPLGALLGVHYGALGDDCGTRVIMDRVIQEVFQVLEAMGAETHWDSAEAYCEFFYGTQLPATYGHRSSMLQDLEGGKPTEIDAFTGYVCDRGRQLGIQTPTCDVLTGMVRFRELS